MKTEKGTANLDIESSLETIVEKTDIKGSWWRFIIYVSMGLIYFKGKVANWASCVNLPLRIQSMVNFKNKGKLSGKHSILVHLHPRTANPNRKDNQAKCLLKMKSENWSHWWTESWLYWKTRRAEQFDDFCI